MNKYLKQLLDALAQKNAEKQGIVTKALDAGQTPNEEEEKQWSHLIPFRTQK